LPLLKLQKQLARCRLKTFLNQVFYSPIFSPNVLDANVLFRTTHENTMLYFAEQYIPISGTIQTIHMRVENAFPESFLHTLVLCTIFSGCSACPDFSAALIFTSAMVAYPKLQTL
jgi:hypothetical protein